MSNLMKRIGGRTMPHKDVRICLDLALITERDRALAAVANAQAMINADQRLAGGHPALADAKARVGELDAAIREASMTLRITGVDRTTYNLWLAKNPARQGRREEFNSATFFMFAARESGTYIDEHGTEHAITDTEWDEIDRTITDGEHDRIAEAVIEVNRTVGGNDVPFSVLNSGTALDSSEISD